MFWLRRSYAYAALTVTSLLLVGCVSPATIPTVAEKEVINVEDGRATKPVQFRKIVIKLKRGADIGSIQSGLFCVPRAELIYRGGRRTLSGDELTEVFQDELKAANYEVVGDPNALFEDPSTWKAQFLIAGLVKKMLANICFPNLGFGDITNGTGEAFMEVDWQIYSRLDRRVVYRLTTAGTGKVTQRQPAPETIAFLDAFAQATRNMLADQGFHDLVTGKGSLAKAKAPEQSVSVTLRPISGSPISAHISDVRLGVVTVFAGDGHGSGFFIDDKGHILTNEHVVRDANFVKIKLATGREILGEVIATDPRRDVALIKAEHTGIKGLPILLPSPNIGTEVYAIGTPLDESFGTTVSRGIISAYRTEDGLEFIQSDVNILPGNSGGPLLDATGNVIGIAVQGVVFGGSMSGLNLFIPIRDALEKLSIRFKKGSV